MFCTTPTINQITHRLKYHIFCEYTVRLCRGIGRQNIVRIITMEKSYIRIIYTLYRTSVDLLCVIMTVRCMVTQRPIITLITRVHNAAANRRVGKQICAHLNGKYFL